MRSKSIILTHIFKEVADKISRKASFWAPVFPLKPHLLSGLQVPNISTVTASPARPRTEEALWVALLRLCAPLIGYRSRLRVDYSPTTSDPRSLLFAQHTLRLRNNPNSAHYETGRVPRRSPQEAGEGGHGGVHGDAHVCQREAEHQEIAGGPQLPHFEEGDHCHRI